MKVHDLTAPRNLARFSVPSMISFLLIRTYVHLECCWLPPACECHLSPLYAYPTMLVIIGVPRYCSWEGLLDCFSPFSPFHTSMCIDPACLGLVYVAISRRDWFTADLLVIWLLQSFPWCLLNHRRRSRAWAPHSLLISALCSIVVLWDGLHLL